MTTASHAASLAVPIAVPPRDAWDRVLVATIFAGMAALGYVAFATPLLQPLFAIAAKEEWSALWVRPTVIWVAMGLMLLLLRTLLWLRYRPFASAGAAEAPRLTVIIPAYNEGAMVESSVASVAAADYPRERLEIIVIDDGSTDDTWRYIENAARRFPALVHAIRLPKNLGK
ncbi:MAG TPA: glycosyltransferase, partial [Burkholderiales bacterium]|nr:glycosyltransferase [Burkholderiales bacterium]